MASSARVTSFPLHLFVKTISATFPAVFFRSRDVARISSEGAAPSVRPHRKVLFAVLSRAAVPPGRSLSHACTPARFFAHATFLRRQRERSSISGLAGLLSGWVPPVIRQSVFGTLEGPRRCVLGYFTVTFSCLSGPFYRSCLHGRCAHLTSPMGCRPVCDQPVGFATGSARHICGGIAGPSGFDIV